jgi:hypothetical protein
MGSVLSFTRVTTEELDRAFDDPEWAEELLDDEDRPGCYLDKAWAGLDFLLGEAYVHVELYEDGSGVIDEDVTLFGWDAELVAETARTLSATPFEVLAGHFDPAKMNEREVYPRFWHGDDDLDYLESYYQSLVVFFAETAAAGGAAIRSFSF